jgi:hypothetical protein
MVFRPPFFFVAFLSVVAVVHAGCSNKPNSDGIKPCEPFGGTCTAAVQVALGGGDPREAAELLFYGKYCGANNKCYSNQEDYETNGKGNLGLENRGPPPCDDIDASCQAHDSCLDHKVQLFPGGFDQVPAQDRCECDIKLVSDLFTLYDQGNPTLLCDEGFYDAVTGGITLIGHEAGLIAAGFCCSVLDNCDGESSGPSNELFDDAALFCNGLVSTLVQIIPNFCG